MKTPMKSFRGSPLLTSNMLQTLFPTSIPLIRTNLALYLLYDFFLSSVFFPLTPLFRGKHFLATNIQITWCCFLLCLRHFHIILFSALFRLLSAFLLVRLLSVVGFRLAFCLCLFLRPCLFRLQVRHFFRLFFFLLFILIFFRLFRWSPHLRLHPSHFLPHCHHFRLQHPQFFRRPRLCFPHPLPRDLSFPPFFFRLLVYLHQLPRDPLPPLPFRLLRVVLIVLILVLLVLLVLLVFVFFRPLPLFGLLSFSFPSAWPPPLGLRLFLRHCALSFEVVASPARPIFLVSLFLCHYVGLTCLLCSLHSHSLSRFRHAQHSSAPAVEGPARRTGDSTPCMRSTSSSASSSAGVTSRMASNSAFFFSSSAFFLASSSRAFRSASAFAFSSSSIFSNSASSAASASARTFSSSARFLSASIRASRAAMRAFFFSAAVVVFCMLLLGGGQVFRWSGVWGVYVRIVRHLSAFYTAGLRTDHSTRSRVPFLRGKYCYVP